ncbi:MAG: 3-alpha,7-alpha,12-alpha-trihydroxy-5-beta-cholest-24-enoyl-CoA hydratase [Planctomycetaceae bacterium]|nr:3-alpha,7-alpha,12-alpha-trihydroxy-5-beta-cholest-24-enoyl-CoA hydratase [Planctomycetaceae bacterium]
MPIDYDKLMEYDIPDCQQTYTERDVMLYALGLGFGIDPVNRLELPFVYEKGLQVLPTMCCVLGAPGMWLAAPDTGVDYVRVVHGEMGFKIHKPLPSSARITGKTRVTDVFDKGQRVGALILQEREIVEQRSGDKLATATSTTFARGDGGFGGARGPSRVKVIPEVRDPDEVCDLPTLPHAALIYRLSGDYNPLHCDPDVAEQAGFDRPILHGLCTYGTAGHAILRSLCDYDPLRFTGMQARFSAPVFPGETIRTEMWRDGVGQAVFRSRVLERDVVVLDQGTAKIGG